MIRSFLEEKKNILPVLIGSFLFFLYFFSYLGNSLIGLDTHTFINYAGTTNNWLDIGRQGAVLLHKIFFQSQFSMFYAEVMALIFYLLALLSYTILFQWIGNIPAWKSCFFFLTCMIHPIWAEQFYFTLQIFDIAVGMFLVPLILFMTFQNKWIWWIGSIPFLILLFSIYQTFVVIYIAGCILCVLLLYFQNDERIKNQKNNFFFGLGIRQIVIFLTAFIINTIITRIFFSHGTYLDGQIRWGIDPFWDCVQRVWSTIWYMLSGEGIFYTITLSISLLLSGVGLIIYLWKYRNKKEKWFVVAAWLILQICPFFLTIYLGTTSVYRSQFNLPFVIGCNVLLILILFHSVSPLKSLNTVVVAGLIFVLLSQYYATSLLQYTTVVTRHEDERRAYTIEREIIKKTGGVSKPVAMIGYWHPSKNGAYVYAENTHLSIFEFGWWGDPRYFELTRWITEYMKSQGINIRAANAEQVIKARKIAQDMPVFPMDGSIKELDDIVIIKIAPDDYFASEVMGADVIAQEIQDLSNSNNYLKADINSVELIDNILTITGWVLEPQCNSNYVLPSVHLWNEENGMLYSLSSGTQSRGDLTTAFPDGTDYSHSGVMAKGSMDQLPTESLDHCKIFLSITRNGEIKYFDTGKYVTDYITNNTE